MLAKLLAKENLRIQHGNYTTAFFDTKSRVLGLPIWKTSGKNVYDLLVGHEVGHALFTPTTGIDKFRQELPEVPFDICNIVEDIRIERMIQDTYPGLATSFRQAYETLVADNFFGTKGKDVASMNFADRLNLFAKAGKASDVNLTAEEQAIYDRCIKATDFDEVIQICKDIAHLVGKRKDGKKPGNPMPENSPQAGDKQENPPENPASDESSLEDSDETGNSQLSDKDGSESDESDDAKPDQEDSETAEANPSENQAGDEPQSNEESESAKGGSDAANATLKSELTSQTASSFEKAVKDIQHVDNYIHFGVPTAKTIAELTIPYKKILQSRQLDKYCTLYMNHADTRAHYLETKTSAKKYVAGLTREFEMRKSANQYSRASVAKTGTLNMAKLHSYRYSDDIFKSITKLANAKNHGMMMFVDYSSSMANSLGHVLEHTVNLVMFCRSLNIPFEVYGFTNPAQYYSPLNPVHNELNMQYLSLIQTFSSKMSKAELDLAIEQTLAQAFYWKSGLGRQTALTVARTSGRCPAMCHYESLSGTPLQECVVAAHILVDQFRKTNPVEKMNVVFLTDGEGSGLQRHRTSQGGKVSVSDLEHGPIRLKGILNGREVTLEYSYAYETLIENLRKTTGATVVGFFVPNSEAQGLRNARNAQQSLAYTRKHMNPESNRLAYRKNGSLIIEGGYGFSEYYVLAPGKDLDIDTDDEFDTDFEVDDSKKSQSKLTRAFTEFNNTKRTQRVILSKFSQVIA